MRSLLFLLCLPLCGQNFQPGGSKISWLHNHNAVIGNGLAAAWDLKSRGNVSLVYPDIASTTGVTLQAGNLLSFPASHSGATVSLSGLSLANTGVQFGPCTNGAYLTAPSGALSASTGSNLSLFVYTKPARVSQYQSLLSKAPPGGTTGYSLTMTPAAVGFLSLDAGYGDGTNTFSTSVSADWVFNALWNGTNYAINGYYNGVQNPLSAQSSTATLTNAGTFTLGAENGGASICYAGALYYAAVWNRVLSLTEASELHRVVTAYPQINQPPSWSLVDFEGSGIGTQNTMNAYYGYDGLNWFPVGTQPVYSAPSGHDIRDPAQTVFGGASYVAYTDDLGYYTGNTSFGLAGSTNGTTWSNIGSVAVTISGTTQVWMGRFYAPCGSSPGLATNCETGGSVYYVPLTISTTACTPPSCAPHAIYIASTSNPSSTSGWSFSASPISGPSLSVDYIDGQLLCLSVCSGGNGNYLLLIVNAVSGVSEIIEPWSCTVSCLTSGTWARLASGNWAGWQVTAGDLIEAPNAFLMPDRWRIYYWDVTATQSYYSDCFQSSSVCFSTAATWSAPVAVSPGGATFQNGSIIHGAIGL